jgi:circadian clock protein KaiB
MSSPPGTAPGWDLCLYIAGDSAHSRRALHNLRSVCESRVPGQYRIEIVDLRESPHRAEQDQIIAVPTVVRRAPEPPFKVIGDLSDTERLLAGLQLTDDVRQGDGPTVQAGEVRDGTAP